MKLQNIEQIYDLTENGIRAEFKLLFLNCIEQNIIEAQLLEHASKFIKIAKRTYFRTKDYDLLWGDYCNYRKASPSLEYAVRIKPKTKIRIEKDEIANISMKKIKKFCSISEEQMAGILKEIKKFFMDSYALENHVTRYYRS